MLLGPFSEHAHDYVAKVLHRKGVELHLGTRVVERLQHGLGAVDPLLHRAGHVARQGVELRVLLVQVLVEARVECVDTTVDVRELVLEPVHPPRDALEPARHPVEPAVQLAVCSLATQRMMKSISVFGMPALRSYMAM